MDMLVEQHWTRHAELFQVCSPVVPRKARCLHHEMQTTLADMCHFLEMFSLVFEFYLFLESFPPVLLMELFQLMPGRPEQWSSHKEQSLVKLHRYSRGEGSRVEQRFRQISYQ